MSESIRDILREAGWAQKVVIGDHQIEELKPGANGLEVLMGEPFPTLGAYQWSHRDFVWMVPRYLGSTHRNLEILTLSMPDGHHIAHLRILKNEVTDATHFPQTYLEMTHNEQPDGKGWSWGPTERPWEGSPPLVHRLFKKDHMTPVALCGFSQRHPSQWPAGHSATMGDRGPYITCPMCRILGSDGA